MRIDFKIDTRGLKLKIPREEKRLAFNTAQAINDTAKEIQLDERANLDRKFTIRKPEFMYRLIKIFQWASPRQGRAYAEIGVDATKKRLLLPKFEKGGIKEPVKGKNVAVPVTGEAARPTFALPVTAELQIGRLRFRRHVTESGKVQWKGAKGTFIIPLGRGGRKRDEAGQLLPKRKGPHPEGPGIWQYANRAYQRLYTFVPRPQLQAVLDFVEVANRTINERFQQNFARAYQRRK